MDPTATPTSTTTPLILFDRYGLFAEQDTPFTDVYPRYAYGFHNRAEMVEAGFNVFWDAGKEILSSPYVCGSMQVAGGLAEAGVGAGMAAYSGGIAGFLGWPMMAQGIDHYVAGMNSLFSGIPQQTATSKILQKTGISTQSANFIDNSIATIATMGGATYLKVAQVAATEFTDLAGLARSTTTVQTIDPNLVRFSQDSIKKTFRDGRCIYQLVEDLQSGVVKAHEIPPIRLFDRNGVLFSLDNRRLEVFKRAGVEVPYRMATDEEIIIETAKKFAPINEGTIIRVRGK